MYLEKVTVWWRGCVYLTTILLSVQNYTTGTSFSGAVQIYCSAVLLSKVFRRFHVSGTCRIGFGSVYFWFGKQVHSLWLHCNDDKWGGRSPLLVFDKTGQKMVKLAVKTNYELQITLDGKNSKRYFGLFQIEDPPWWK